MADFLREELELVMELIRAQEVVATKVQHKYVDECDLANANYFMGRAAGLSDAMWILHELMNKK